MNENELRFGKFIEQKRKVQGIILCGLTSELDIVPTYMSDIGKADVTR